MVQRSKFLVLLQHYKRLRVLNYLSVIILRFRLIWYYCIVSPTVFVWVLDYIFNNAIVTIVNNTPDNHTYIFLSWELTKAKKNSPLSFVKFCQAANNRHRLSVVSCKFLDSTTNLQCKSPRWHCLRHLQQHSCRKHHQQTNAHAWTNELEQMTKLTIFFEKKNFWNRIVSTDHVWIGTCEISGLIVGNSL